MITREYPELDHTNESMLYALGIWTAAAGEPAETIHDDDGTWRIIGEIRYYPALDGFMDRQPRKGITERERGILRGAAAQLFMELPDVDDSWVMRRPEQGAWFLETKVCVPVED
ncbi:MULTISPECIES: hypothetical protein [Nocardia]|uniref:hypothetical protein n=1 Tax=Nocardia TaxID=1817 RepID=UPI000D68E922|nr:MULTISPECIES: hypothetical protein [Nocardia]